LTNILKSYRKKPKGSRFYGTRYIPVLNWLVCVYVLGAEIGVIRVVLLKPSLCQGVARHEETRSSHWRFSSSLSGITVQSPLGSLEFSRYVWL